MGSKTFKEIREIIFKLLCNDDNFITEFILENKKVFAENLFPYAEKSRREVQSNEKVDKFIFPSIFHPKGSLFCVPFCAK